jgi:hypothetical protein
MKVKLEGHFNDLGIIQILLSKHFETVIYKETQYINTYFHQWQISPELLGICTQLGKQAE